MSSYAMDESRQRSGVAPARTPATLADDPGGPSGTVLLADALAGVSTKPASYLRAARQIRAVPDGELRTVRISVMSSFTAAILQPYLLVEGARRGLKLSPYFCPFNQIELQAFEPSSQLYTSDPDIIAIALRLEESAPELSWRYVALPDEDIESALEALRDRLDALVREIRKRSVATILLFNFAPPAILDAGLADSSLEVPQADTIARANATVAAVSREHPGTYVFDLARIATELGLERLYDEKLYRSTRVPFSFWGQLQISRQMARYATAATRPPCKCLVVDLDNTLWGGVLGEVHLQGIELGEDYPGNVYKQFQRRLRSLRDQGVLLAIASKNDVEDVIEAFESHPDMVLRWSDFSAAQVHWQDKASSLRAIAEELNIGLDSVAFFDDSPVERALIEQQLPEVTVIGVPEDPLGYAGALDLSGAFDRLLISGDDRRRADMMREAVERRTHQEQAASIDDFLHSLEMVAEVGQADPETLPRIEQLLAKTNQFNLTARRHPAQELQRLVDQEGAIVLWMRLRDRFGDNGLIGVAIGVPDDPARWRIDALLLSCRVIGRQAERVLVGTLADLVAERGGQALVGEYRPSAKNRQVARLYPTLGFEPLPGSDSEWVLDPHTGVESPDFIEVEYASGLDAVRSRVLAGRPEPGDSPDSVDPR